MFDRIAPMPRFNTHRFMLSWFNDLMFDLKQMVAQGHTPLIAPRRLHQWERYREELNCTDWDRPIRGGDLPKKHVNEIGIITRAIDDLLLIFDKQAPSLPFDEARIEELDRCYQGIESCKEDMIKY